jgi:serine/threonine protein kinase
MHNRGWVHGDIKPSNIIITPDGGAVLIVEVAAYELDATRTVAYSSCAYAAPEQSQGGSPPVTGVYQLAKVLEHYQTKSLSGWIRAALDVTPARRPALA